MFACGCVGLGGSSCFLIAVFCHVLDLRADPNFLLAVAASQRPMTQRAILHSIPGSTPRQEYPFLHRNVEGLKAEISVPNDEAEAEFWQEVLCRSRGAA